MKKTLKLRRFPRLQPQPVRRGIKASTLIRHSFLAYNAARLREGAELLTRKMLVRNGLVGLTITGALTPAGLGQSCLIPLIKAGFIDWIITTGANLYHDLHYGLDMALHRGSPFLDDVQLRASQIIRIYDILFDYSVLLDTDAFVRRCVQAEEFQRPMGTDEFHYRLGRYVSEREKKLGGRDTSLIAAAYRYGVPCFTSSPGDSSIGMNIAALAIAGNQLQFDVNRDVNQTAALVYDAKRHRRTSSVFILGGGSPKNFALQTEPQIQEIFGLPERGHDYFLQVTDARPDTGGLSGATPAEAVSWGKVDPARLPDAVVCYADSTIALPLLTAYALDSAPARKPKRLIDHRDRLLQRITADYRRSKAYQPRRAR